MTTQVGTFIPVQAYNKGWGSNGLSQVAAWHPSTGWNHTAAWHPSTGWNQAAAWNPNAGWNQAAGWNSIELSIY